MQTKNTSDLNVEHPLGKGEVVSSILTGSTTKAADNRQFSHAVVLPFMSQSRERMRNRATQSVEYPGSMIVVRSEDIEAACAELKAFAAKHPEAAAWCHRVRDNLRRLALDPSDRPLWIQTMRNAASLRASLSSRERGEP